MKGRGFCRGGAFNAAGGGGSSSYSANFSTVENPLSEGGIWLNGAADGTDWNNCLVPTAGRVIGAVNITTPRYADDIAMLKTSFRTFAANQWAQGTLYVASGYTGGGGSHECELYLRGAISANVARGYECSVGLAGGAPYAFIVRWEGPVGSYSTLWDPHGGVGSYDNTFATPADGDVYYAQIVGTVITLKQNGVTIGHYDTAGDGTKWSSGQPGLGFWPVDGADRTQAGWRAWSAGDL